MSVLVSCNRNKGTHIDIEETLVEKEDTIMSRLKAGNPRLKIESKKINFKNSPVSIKDYTLKDEAYWITSGIIDKENLDSFCDYKNYHLKRRYNFLNKSNDSLITNLDVYVVDDESKMSREGANESFMSIETNDSSFKLWNTFYVGMPVNSALDYINDIGYYNKLSSQILICTSDYNIIFSVKKSLINRIRAKRVCDIISNSEEKFITANYDINLEELGLKNRYEIINFKNSKSPRYLKYDFNGDGKFDIAYLIRLKEIKDEDSSGVRIIINHSSTDYHIVGNGMKLEENDFAIDWMHDWGIFKERNTYKTVVDSITNDILDDEMIALERDAIALYHDDYRTGLIYWNGEKYIYIHQGD